MLQHTNPPTPVCTPYFSTPPSALVYKRSLISSSPVFLRIQSTTESTHPAPTNPPCIRIALVWHSNEQGALSDIETTLRRALLCIEWNFKTTNLYYLISHCGSCKLIYHRQRERERTYWMYLHCKRYHVEWILILFIVGLASHLKKDSLVPINRLTMIIHYTFRTNPVLRTTETFVATRAADSVSYNL